MVKFLLILSALRISLEKCGMWLSGSRIKEMCLSSLPSHELNCLTNTRKGLHSSHPRMSPACFIVFFL